MITLDQQLSSNTCCFNQTNHTSPFLNTETLSLLDTTFTIITKYLVTIIMFWDWCNVKCDYIVRSLMICTPHQILFRWSNRDEWDGWGILHEWGREEVHTGFWWGNVWETDHLERLKRRWEDNIKMDIQGVACAEGEGVAWTWLSWLRIGTGGGLL